MKTKTFQDRVIDTAGWTIIITLIFFAISFFVVSDISKGSKFDPQKAYNLIKDTFTFGATILTPIVAVVFFSDWKEQHVIKDLESKSNIIYSKVRSITLSFWDMQQFVEDDENLTEDKREAVNLKFSNLSNEITGFGLLISEFDKKNSTTEKFITCSNSIKDELRGKLYYLELMHGCLVKINDPIKYNNEYIGETKDEFIERNQILYADYSQNWNESHARYSRLELELEKLKDSYTVKI